MASWLQNLRDKAQSNFRGWGYAGQQGEFGHVGAAGKIERGVTELLKGEFIGRADAKAPQQFQTDMNQTPWVRENDQVNTDDGIRGGAPQPSPDGQGVPAGQQTREEDINRQTGDFQAMVDRDYETTMSGIAGEEKGFREQAGTAESKIKAQYGTAKTSIGEELATRETGLAGEEQTAATSAKTAQQEARDMFREIQQQNIAQLSGLGISSSSVSEALAERLGVETARRIGGVTGTFNEIKQNIAKEKTRIQTYYKQRVTDLEENMAVGIKEIQDSLMGGLRQISQARTVAATDKANQRTEIWSRAQTALAGLKADAQDFAQSLEEWERKRTASLQSVEQDPNFLANLQAGAATFAQDPAFSQFNFAPQAALSSKGQWSGQIKSTPKEEESEYDKLLREAGIN